MLSTRALYAGVAAFLIVFLGVPAAFVLYRTLAEPGVTPAQRLALGWTLILLLPGIVLHPLTVASLRPWYSRLSVWRFAAVETLTALMILGMLRLPIWAEWRIFLGTFVVPPLVTLGAAWLVRHASRAPPLEA